MPAPLAYFITFHTYGTWLQGDQRGSVDFEHNQVGSDLLAPDPALTHAHQEKMNQPAYRLDAPGRDLVLKAVRDVCTHGGWQLLAVHVRTSHVHIVLAADSAPEKVMNDFKVYASRALNRAALDVPERKRWSRHGSTRYLNHAKALSECIAYVLERQGEPMALYDGRTYEPRP
jgi:REP element-mobilizing transposase RayT